MLGLDWRSGLCQVWRVFRTWQGAECVDGRRKYSGVGRQTWDRDQKIKAGTSFCSQKGVGEGSRAEQMVRSEVSMLKVGQGLLDSAQASCSFMNYDLITCSKDQISQTQFLGDKNQSTVLWWKHEYFPEAAA